MCDKSFTLKITTFLLMFLVGLLFVDVSQQEFFEAESQPKPLLYKKKILKKEEPKIYSDKKSSQCGWSYFYTDKNGKTREYNSEMARKDEEAKVKLAKENGTYDIPATGIKVLSKPKPQYTKEARENEVWGVMKLKVTFLSNGKIGGVKAIEGYIGSDGSTLEELPDGLTQQAIRAARKIKFKAPTRYGEPYTVTKTVQYNFNIY